MTRISDASLRYVHQGKWSSLGLNCQMASGQLSILTARCRYDGPSGRTGAIERFG